MRVELTAKRGTWNSEVGNSRKEGDGKWLGVEKQKTDKAVEGRYPGKVGQRARPIDMVAFPVPMPSPRRGSG